MLHVADPADPRNPNTELAEAIRQLKRYGNRIKRAPCQGRCQICGNETYFRWCSMYGFGACVICGAPYKIYFFDGDGPNKRRVFRAPQLMIDPAWVPLAKRYWREKHRNVDPGAYNLNGEMEVASRDDFQIHDEWIEAHCDEWPEDPKASLP